MNKLSHTESAASSATAAAPQPGKGARKGTVALFAILVFTAATGSLSQTALNNMLTVAVDDFGIEVDLGQWATTIYMLAMGVAVPLTGYLWRRLDNRNYTMMTLALMLAGSLIDFFAPTFAVLIVGRVMQAVAAGFSMAVMQTVAMTGFGSNKTATAMGIAGIAMGFAPNIGPTVGGLFVGGAGWRWFFVALAAVPVVLMALTLLTVPKGGEHDRSVKLDLASFVVCAIGFGGLLTGFSEASTNGVGSLTMWIPVAAGVVFLWLFAHRQHRVQNPLINLDIFKSRKFKIGFWMNNLLFGSFMGITLIMPLYIEGAIGGTAADAGTALLPGAIAALICNPLSGILGDKIGKTRVMKIAAAIMAAGALLALTYSESSPIWYVAMVQGIRGTGVSSSIGCMLAWLLEDLPRDIVADGTSFSLVARQASASLGTAVMVFLVTVVLDITGGGMLAYTCAFGFAALLAVVLLVMVFAYARE